MKTSLVTGGCGFIGSHIVDELVKRGHNVIVIDDLSARENEEFYFNDNAQYCKRDISKDHVCKSLFKGVENVFHLAARSRIQPTIDSPGECFEVNAVGTQRVLEWSRLNRVKNFVYSSTSSLYGHQNQIPFNPNMPADCLNPYSMSKWMGEQICKLYSQLYDFNSTTLRYFNVYGPREPIKGQYAPVVGLFKRQSVEGKPMTIVGDGEQRRDFTYIDDIVEGVIRVLDNPPSGNEEWNSDFPDPSSSNAPWKLYNIGNNEPVELMDYIEAIEDSLNLKAEKELLPLQPGDVPNTFADVSELERDFDFKPKTPVKEGVKNFIKWYRGYHQL